MSDKIIYRGSLISNGEKSINQREEEIKKEIEYKPLLGSVLITDPVIISAMWGAVV